MSQAAVLVERAVKGKLETLVLLVVLRDEVEARGHGFQPDRFRGTASSPVDNPDDPGELPKGGSSRRYLQMCAPKVTNYCPPWV